MSSDIFHFQKNMRDILLKLKEAAKFPYHIEIQPIKPHSRGFSISKLLVESSDEVQAKSSFHAPLKTISPSTHTCVNLAPMKKVNHSDMVQT
jgi:hypothetical protein